MQADATDSASLCKHTGCNQVSPQLRFDQLIVGAGTGRAQFGFYDELLDDLLTGHVLLLRHAQVDGGSNFHLRRCFRFLLGFGRRRNAGIAFSFIRCRMRRRRR